MAHPGSLAGHHGAGTPPPAEARPPELSVVVPLYDEEQNVDPMVGELLDVLNGLELSSEVVLVDDGSRDQTAARAGRWCHSDPRVHLIELRRNFGQTAALSAGFDYARGRVVVAMDGDQQNDPHDIPRLLRKLDEGYDIVSGWRRDRQDALLLRKLPSAAANRLISWVTGTRLHDYGCTLKAYRHDVICHLRLYGELHRFIPALSQVVGARVTELPVNHRARVRGRSKYGISRTFRVLLDLLTVKFLISYFGRPMRLFGSTGFVSIALGSAILLWLLGDKVVLGQGLSDRPVVLLGMLLLVVGVQFLSIGILGELIIRVYHEEGRRRSYLIRRLDADDAMLPAVAAHRLQDPAGTGSTLPGADATAPGTPTLADGWGKRALMPWNPRRGWKRPFTLALKIAFSCGLLAWVLHKTNLDAIGQSLASASPEWLTLAVMLGIAATLVQAKQWQRLLVAVGLDRSITRSLRIVFIGNTFNAILPSSIGGDASRAVYIADRPGERAQGAAAVVLQRLLNFPGMVLLMGFGLALTITSAAVARVRPVALAGAVIGLAVLAVTVSPLIGRVAGSTSLARLPGWRPLSAGLRVLDGFRSQRPELVAAAGRGAVFWSLTVLNQWCYIQAVGIHPSLGYAAVAVTLVNLATMLPLSVNGFGAREGGYIALLAGVGLGTTAQAVSAGLLISAQSLLFGLIGVCCLFTLRSTALWARRAETATASAVTWLYALPEQLSFRRLFLCSGNSRYSPKHAATRSTRQITTEGRDGPADHGTPANRVARPAEAAGGGRADQPSIPEEV
jgi:glycosyltransferase involved in cell wall biosynthesis/uncharacterized membrane protein YbhN (UPF0104 family)